MIRGIPRIVKKRHEEDDFKYHIKLVVKYARKLARATGADLELVELGAWLHDIGRPIDRENHEIVGAAEAEKILSELEYPEKRAKKVARIIQVHRSSKGAKPETIEEEIVANADALAHFDAALVLLWLGFEKGHSFEESIKWVSEKIKRDWDKVTLPEAKAMGRRSYESTRMVLDSAKKLL